MADAQSFCLMFTGGNLASIHSAAENAFVTQLAAAIATGTATDSTGQTWTGLTLLTVDPTGTTWEWCDGSVVNFPTGQPYPLFNGPAPWGPLVPTGNFGCSILITNTNGATFSSSAWNEADCNVAQANFVCKAPTII
uniref:C-type lectin domain-containing protein n=1 Tax=Panagrolaimus sp. JU765 TaxID=591449 RepID=A0AC34Q5U0_9BILA